MFLAIILFIMAVIDLLCVSCFVSETCKKRFIF